MIPATLIEQELAAAQAAQQRGNDGKARVCARRAVAHAAEAWCGLPLDYGVEMPWHISGTFSKTHPSLFLSDKRPSD